MAQWKCDYLDFLKKITKFCIIQILLPIYFSFFCFDGQPQNTF